MHWIYPAAFASSALSPTAATVWAWVDSWVFSSFSVAAASFSSTKQVWGECLKRGKRVFRRIWRRTWDQQEWLTVAKSEQNKFELKKLSEGYSKTWKKCIRPSNPVNWVVYMPLFRLFLKISFVLSIISIFTSSQMASRSATSQERPSLPPSSHTSVSLCLILSFKWSVTCFKKKTSSQREGDSSSLPFASWFPVSMVSLWVAVVTQNELLNAPLIPGSHYY